MSGFMDWLRGPKEKFTQVSTQTPGQGAFQSRALDHMMGLLQPGGGLDWRANEEQARGDFMGKTIPGIAEMFTSMGGGGQNSSAFQGALGSAGAGLERGLASDRSNYNMQLLQSLMGPGMQPAFDTYHEKAGPGFAQHTADAALRAALAWATGGTSELGGMGNMFGAKKENQGQPGMSSNNLMQLFKLMQRSSSGQSPMGYNETYQG